MVEPLYNGSQESWASKLQAERDKLERAIEAHEPTRMKYFFRRYYREAARRFFEVDTTLKQKCSDLRAIGDQLKAVLEVLG
jgi:hypothetical protein